MQDTPSTAARRPHLSLRGFRGLQALVLAGMAALPAWSAASADTAAVRDPGRDLYLEGRLPDGRRLLGQGAGGAAVPTPCAGCHRRSGMGGGEGSQRVAPITGPDLFQAPATLAQPAAGDRLPRARPGAVVQPGRRLTRPGYDEATLARALREGLDPAGRPLGELMPRYPDLDDAAVQALSAHLATLRTDSAPGWQDGTLRLATVITPDAPAARVQALLDMLPAWAAQNQSARSRYRPALQVWRLSGPASGWAEQLAAWQAAEPVFAVLSGAAGASADSWAPVQDWCEREALPCLLPLLDTPPEPAPDSVPRWSLQGSEGSRLEAAALALRLAGVDAAGSRLQQWTDDPTGARAAELLIERLQEERPDTPLQASSIEIAPGIDDASLLARWCALDAQDTLVLWIGRDRLDALDRALAGGPMPDAACPGPGRIDLVASRAGFDVPPAEAWRDRTWLIGGEVDEVRLQARNALALLPWARRSGVAVTQPREQAKVHAATMWFTEALARMQGRLGRDYLMESIERAVDNRALAGPWLSVSLGPDQRVAVKSARFMQRVTSGTNARWQAVGAALRP